MINIDEFNTFSDIFSHDFHPSSIEGEDQAMIKKLTGYLAEWYPINPVVFSRLLQSIFLQDGTSSLEGVPFKAFKNREKYINEIRNILSPIFTDELKANIQSINSLPDAFKRAHAAKEYHEKLSQMEFLDPKCGGGSCLIELYSEIREAEDNLIALEGGCVNLERDVKVKPGNFYGLDDSQSNVNIAIVMLYIAEEQAMNRSYSKFKNLCSLPNFKPFTSPIHIEKLQVKDNGSKGLPIVLKGVKIISHSPLPEISALH